MIKNTTYRWAIGLCALLLVAATAPLSASDAALPPGADFQEGFQGANVHHREKRSPVIFIKPWIPTFRGSSLIPRRENQIPYGFYNRHYYDLDARERILGDKLGGLPPDERIPLKVADQIIKFGATIEDKSGVQMKFIRGKGLVILQPPGIRRFPTVLKILPLKRISGSYPPKK